ncbi:hypothetical protein C6P42_003344 [Pichia californica]|nr:hypothetical protein C6P42_003344 [[Candida] californica]
MLFVSTTTTTTTSTTSAPSTSSNIINSPDSNIKRNDSSIQIERERSEIRNSIASLRNSITGDDNIDLNSNSNSNSNKRYNSNGININSNKTGLRSVQTEKFNMFIYQTVTGIKIIILTSIDLNEYQISNFQIIIYKLYSDYVMKNPFYSLDMPIRIKLFDDKIMSAVINYNIK